MKIGLFLRPKNQFLKEAVAAVVEFLHQNGQEIVVSRTIPRDLIRDFDFLEMLNMDEIPEAIDAMFSIGGDGTFLGAARLIAHTHKPILGIHLGGLGFLADVSMDNYRAKLSKFLAGDYSIEEKSMLTATVHYEKRVESYFALNEFVIDRGRFTKMIKLKTYVDGDYLNTYRADGLIVSTPTGSTAYSLAAGGPIILPHLDIIIISPICPHSLSARPVVVSGEQKIRLDCEKFTRDVSLVGDGQIRVLLDGAQRIEIQRAEDRLRIIRFSGDSFFQTLRQKMGWGLDVRGH